ncbi:MAG: hypothetical protein PHE49_09525 [bacterium]|nr:hypothetical protein [bacterium]
MKENKKIEDGFKIENGLIKKRYTGSLLGGGLSLDGGIYGEKTIDLTTAPINLLGTKIDAAKLVTPEGMINESLYDPRKASMIPSYSDKLMSDVDLTRVASPLNPTGFGEGVFSILKEQEGILAREEKERKEKEENLAKNIENKVMDKIKPMLEPTDKEKITKEADGLKLVEDNLKNGSTYYWFCGSCREKIKEFKGDEGLRDMKKYLEDFKEKKFKACTGRGKKHLCWFEVEEKTILWLTRADI